MKAVCLWSGGKDSCFACYKAKEQGIDIRYLLNFASDTERKSRSHEIDSELILRQAELTGIPVIQKYTSSASYEKTFKETINSLKKEGVEAIVFGDIYLQEHKDWIDRICGELSVKAILPLWKIDTDMLINEFIGLGFETVVVTAKKDIMEKEHIGRVIDRGFVDELVSMNKDIDLCGEKGEFHTLVTAGPLFNKKRINLKETGKTLKEGRHVLNILNYEIA
jgi:diphthine-ammonia ligase